MGMHTDVMSYIAGQTIRVSSATTNALDDVERRAKEMDALSSLMYAMSKRRISRSLPSLMAEMNATMRRDLGHAAFMATQYVDRHAAVSGIYTATQGGIADQVSLARNALPKQMSPTLQASAEFLALAAMRINATNHGKAVAQEVARVRRWRDAAYTLMNSHIELGNGVRAIGDALSAAGRADLTLDVSNKLAQETHALNMRKIAWEKERQLRILKDNDANAMGSLFGQGLAGFAQGFKFKGTG